MPEVNRKKGESFESLLRRFGRRMQESGKMLQAKKIRFHSSEKSKLVLRKSALHKNKTRVKYTYLIRSGKIKEEDLYARKSHKRR